MKIAAVQLKAGKDKAENIKQALALSNKAIARQAKLIVLPEVFNFRGRISTARDMASVAEDIPGPSIRPFMDLAKKMGVYILAGSVYERAENSSKAYNTSVLIGRDGRVLRKYRKIHLFKARIDKKSICESDMFREGEKPAVARIGNFAIGMTVCYDLRFPWLYRYYGSRGADIVVVPSCFTRLTGQAHWEVLLRARAIENQCCIIAPNQFGADERGVAAYGNSMIVDPWGKILSRASPDKEQILFAEIKKEIFTKSRKILPGIRPFLK